MEGILPDLGRLLAACAAGALIGFERELHDKPAGLRTNVMICLGAALFTLLSVHVGEQAGIADPGRIAAQIVTGVGFLGAGAIIQSRGNVIGLTTAASIWLVASLGMAFGLGEFFLGAIVTVAAGGVLFGLSFVEDAIASWRTTVKFSIEIEPTPELTQLIKRRARELGLRRHTWQFNKTTRGLSGYLEVTGPEDKLDEFQDTLMSEPGVISLQRI